MKNKIKISSIALTLVTGLVFSTNQAYGFEIGAINIHSHLSQPLDANIELRSISEDELKNLDVTLASKAQFKKVGLNYIRALSTLRFNVIKYKGKNYIQITSTTAVREPLLDIVIKLKWNNGQRFQNYTLLFSPQ